MKLAIKFASLFLAINLLNACATSQLLENNRSTHTITERQTLIQDSVRAFGKPAQIINNLPSDAIVIVGNQQSYVLTQGGGKFTTLIGQLDPRYIRITNNLSFYSEKNDGKFSGKLDLRYSRLASDVGKNDIQFFLQNGVQECTSESDKRMNVQSFCFEIPLQGLIYPVARNLGSLRPLSKSYPIEIYTQTEKTVHCHYRLLRKFLIDFKRPYKLVPTSQNPEHKVSGSLKSNFNRLMA